MKHKCLLFFICFTSIMIFLDIRASYFSFRNNSCPNYNQYTKDHFYEEMVEYSKKVEKQNAAHNEMAFAMRRNNNYALMLQNSISSAAHFSVLYQAIKAIFRRPQTKTPNNRLLFSSIFDITQFYGQQLRQRFHEYKSPNEPESSH